MKSYKYALISTIFASMAFTGCKNKARDPRLIMTPDADMAAVIEGNNAFALDLYQMLSGEDGNLFLSPFSISAALALALVGAEGDTQTQMEDVMQVMLAEDAFHDNFGALMRDLGGEDRGRGYELDVANRIYGQQDYGWDDTFKAVNEEDYGAPLEELDFSADAEAARQEINDWVAEQTQDKIPELYKANDITTQTRMAITNAIYFQAQWAEQFDESRTWDDDFTTADGREVIVPLMHQEGEMEWAHVDADGLTLLRLPYEDDEVSMILLLPDEGVTVFDVEALLEPDTLSGWIDALQSEKVTMSLPRWETKQRFVVSDMLVDMGMTDAFDAAMADFSGMTGGDNELFISKLIHEACIDVNEAGTEAAAATGAVLEASTPAFFYVDRAFNYLIRDDLTGSILFMGRVADPS